jgi:amidase/aspartyl-tRNA(Asn)/glutamyl-tRNA(Gln) amidotransferase subunit A
MALDRELAGTTVVELAHRIRRRDLSPVEVIDATLEAIDRENARLNAFVHLDPEGPVRGRGRRSRR